MKLFVSLTFHADTYHRGTAGLFFPAEGGLCLSLKAYDSGHRSAVFMHGAKLSLAKRHRWRQPLAVASVGHVQHFWYLSCPRRTVCWWAPVNVDLCSTAAFLYLCILPAAMQSAIAFTLHSRVVTSRPRWCSASASSLLGIFLYIAAARSVW